MNPIQGIIYDDEDIDLLNDEGIEVQLLGYYIPNDKDSGWIVQFNSEDDYNKSSELITIGTP